MLVRRALDLPIKVGAGLIVYTLSNLVSFVITC